jgi:peptide chain release factor 3
LDEISSKLALDVTPASWPIGMGRDFRGCYNLLDDTLLLFDRSKGATMVQGLQCKGLEDPLINEKLPSEQAAQLRDDVAMVRGLCPDFDLEMYRAGHLTPVFFGSAVNNFGVAELLQGIARYAPAPRPYQAVEREISPLESKVSGFVFKIQANMDPKHRDRIAFVRLCSGKFNKGMKAFHVRSGKQMIIHTPLLFLAQDREAAEEAFPGDIIGIPNHGNLRIGDVLTEGEKLSFTGIPSFAPELMQRVISIDPLKAKHLGNALTQLAEEGTARVFKSVYDSGWIVGVVGPLQFEVLADRLRTEYNLQVKFEGTTYYAARWLAGNDNAKLKSFIDGNGSSIAYDHNQEPVFLARNAWHLNDARDKNPDITFLQTKVG